MHLLLGEHPVWMTGQMTAHGTAVRQRTVIFTSRAQRGLRKDDLRPGVTWTTANSACGMRVQRESCVWHPKGSVLNAAISTVIINSGQLSSVVYFVVYQFAVVVVDERFLDLQISVIKDGKSTFG